MKERHWYSSIIRCVELDYRNVGKPEPWLGTVCNGWIGGKFNHLHDERYQAHIYCAGKHNENGRYNQTN